MTQVGKKSYLSNFVIDTKLSHLNGLDIKKNPGTNWPLRGNNMYQSFTDRGI